MFFKPGIIDNQIKGNGKLQKKKKGLPHAPNSK